MNLDNPERAWTRPPPDSAVRDVVEALLGPVDDTLQLLAGGQASLCIGLNDRVLRIVRDPTTLDLEEALMSMGWGFFRSPRMLGRGDDWLLVERVAHGPLRSLDGAAAGAALAEIHALSVEACGWLDGALRLREPLPSFAQALLDHAASLPLDAPLTERLLAHLRTHTRELGPPRLLHGDFKVSNVHTCGDTVLVLDWEYAYAGPALMDVGQLMRWDVPAVFTRAFESSYRAHGGTLPEGWLGRARALDAVNLAALLSRSEPGSPRERDLQARLNERLD